MDYEKNIEIPFGAKDSELKCWEYTIPEGMEAIIKDGKVIVREKESEDERIRKGLIEVVSDIAGSWPFEEHRITKKEALAYLEKQKEEEGYEAIPVESTLEYKLGFKAGKESERQKESTWAEDDENGLQQCIKIVVGWEKDYDIVHSPYSNFLKSLPERFNLQPKQEWNEEDENNLNKLLQWNGIPLGLRNWVSGLPEKVGTRPSWKPSEEQMEALRSVLEHEAERVGSSKYLEKANFLYEQLEKLI